ncbi:MAG: hypothetical protein IJ587_05085 [Synergistaceae bacterium]|nr:hypothetical protein [Synergistaceae bacterium]
MRKEKRVSHKEDKQAVKRTVKISWSSEGEKVIWVFDMVDNSGPFAFNTSRKDFDHRGILEKLLAYSRMTWEKCVDRPMTEENRNIIILRK